MKIYAASRRQKFDADAIRKSLKDNTKELKASAESLQTALRNKFKLWDKITVSWRPGMGTYVIKLVDTSNLNFECVIEPLNPHSKGGDINTNCIKFPQGYYTLYLDRLPELQKKLNDITKIQKFAVQFLQDSPTYSTKTEKDALNNSDYLKLRELLSYPDMWIKADYHYGTDRLYYRLDADNPTKIHLLYIYGPDSARMYADVGRVRMSETNPKNISRLGYEYALEELELTPEEIAYVRSIAN